MAGVKAAEVVNVGSTTKLRVRNHDVDLISPLDQNSAQTPLAKARTLLPQGFALKCEELFRTIAGADRPAKAQKRHHWFEPSSLSDGICCIELKAGAAGYKAGALML